MPPATSDTVRARRRLCPAAARRTWAFFFLTRRASATRPRTRPHTYTGKIAELQDEDEVSIAHERPGSETGKRERVFFRGTVVFVGFLVTTSHLCGERGFAVAAVAATLTSKKTATKKPDAATQRRHRRATPSPTPPSVHHPTVSR